MTLIIFPRRLPARAAVALALLAAAGAAALIYGWWTQGAAAPVYRTAPLTRGPLSAVITASGTVNPVVLVQVGSQVSGQIKELYADFNTEVKKGQVIARVDPDIFEAQAAQAEADLAVARASVDLRKADLEQAQANVSAAQANLAVGRAQTDKSRAALADAVRDYERKEKLAGTHAVSLAERDRALSARDQARAQVAANEAQERSLAAAALSAQSAVKTATANRTVAEAQTRQKQAFLNQANVNLAHTYIRAPVDGSVVLRNVDVGQTVAASLQSPLLFTIAQDLRDMQVDASVDEADVGAVKDGQRATFTVDAYPGQIFEGRVVQIRKSPVVVQNVVTYDVVVSAPNPALLLLPGLTASVSIVTAERGDVLRAPAAALRFRPGERAAQRESAERAPRPGDGQLHVLEGDGELRPLAVRLGISDGTWVELVDSPLREGDAVVTGEQKPAGRKPAPPSPRFGPRI